MTDAEALELARIREEFAQSNRQVFTVKYFNDTRLEVRHLIAEAEWEQLQQNKSFPYNIAEIQGFIQRYRQLDYPPIMLLVIEAMHVTLKHQSDISLEEFNDLANTILQYAELVHDREIKVCLALCDVYWYKGYQLKDKDFFKARHFFQKMIKEAEKIHDPRLSAQKMKALIALMRLLYDKQTDAQRDQQMYLILDQLYEINDKHNPELCEKVKELIQFYLQHRVKLSAEDYDVVALNQLLEYIEEHELIRYILLETSYTQAEANVLTDLAFFYWLLEEESMFEHYLQVYFSVEPSDEELLSRIESDYQFENDEQKKTYIDLIVSSREKYVYREKYRKMFKTKK